LEWCDGCPGTTTRGSACTSRAWSSSGSSASSSCCCAHLTVTPLTDHGDIYLITVASL
jgi:hypothetical protein